VLEELLSQGDSRLKDLFRLIDVEQFVASAPELTKVSEASS
jgi:hypothetical protein